MTSASGNNFAADTVKIAVDWRDYADYVVGPAVYDATMICSRPRIVEIDDYTGTPILKTDLPAASSMTATGVFSDPAPHCRHRQRQQQRRWRMLDRYARRHRCAS